jgi:DNA-binding NarL/FixJ family response regulator
VKRVLIADGSPVIRHGLCQMFEENGWDVCEEASDGREAIAKAQAVRPDIIVLDISMPGINGITAAHFLKRIVPDAHLILFTFLDSFFSPEAMQSSGISAVISKSEAAKLIMKAQSLIEAAEEPLTCIPR